MKQMLAKADLQEASCVLAKIPNLGAHGKSQYVQRSSCSRKLMAADPCCFAAGSCLSSRGRPPI